MKKNRLYNHDFTLWKITQPAFSVNQSQIAILHQPYFAQSILLDVLEHMGTTHPNENNKSAYKNFIENISLMQLFTFTKVIDVVVPSMSNSTFF